MNGSSDHRRWRADLAAYLLGSLEDDERAAVEHHLEGCDTCREELRWLQPAIDLLPESVAQVEPPPPLRVRLLAEVGRDVPAPAPTAARPRTAAPRWRTLGFWLRPATGFAVVALIAAAVVGYTLNDQSSSGPRTTTVTSHGVGSLRATLNRSGDSGTLQLTGLDQARSGHVYEAWVQRAGQIHASGLFDARRNGTASLALEHQLGGADAVMVTVEPRGGSRQPTSPAVLNMNPQG